VGRRGDRVGGRRRALRVPGRGALSLGASGGSGVEGPRGLWAKPRRERVRYPENRTKALRQQCT